MHLAMHRDRAPLTPSVLVSNSSPPGWSAAEPRDRQEAVGLDEVEPTRAFSEKVKPVEVACAGGSERTLICPVGCSYPRLGLAPLSRIRRLLCPLLRTLFQRR